MCHVPSCLPALQVKLERESPVEENRLPKALAQTIATAFDLTTGPMVHVTLIPLTQKEEHVLVVNLHYAVADGWSLGVLFKDISLAYNQLKRSNGELALQQLKRSNGELAVVGSLLYELACFRLGSSCVWSTCIGLC